MLGVSVADAFGLLRSYMPHRAAEHLTDVARRLMTDLATPRPEVVRHWRNCARQQVSVVHR